MSNLMQQEMTPLSDLDKCILSGRNEQLTSYVYRGVLRTEGVDKLQRLLFVYISTTGLVRFAHFQFMENGNDSGLYPSRATCNMCVSSHTEAFIRIAQTLTLVFGDAVKHTDRVKSNISYINEDMLKLYTSSDKKELFYKTIPVTLDACYLDLQGSLMYQLEKIARVLEHTSRKELVRSRRIDELESNNKQLIEQLDTLKDKLVLIVEHLNSKAE